MLIMALSGRSLTPRAAGHTMREEGSCSGKVVMETTQESEGDPRLTPAEDRLPMVTGTIICPVPLCCLLLRIEQKP